MQPTVDVIIVNWNSSDSLQRCLGKLLRSNCENFAFSRIVVVDNASDENCGEALSSFPGVQLFQNASNRGFAAACNQGARDSAARYLLFLNPDTGVRPDAIAKTLEFMERPANSGIGICGIRLFDDQGDPALCCSNFPTLGSILTEMSGLQKVAPRIFPSNQLGPEQLRKSRQVDQVIGACFLIRRSLFETLGGFDERFFVYFEEVDLSLRAWHRGSVSYFLREAEAVHVGRVSSNRCKAVRLLYFVRSRLLYCRKHFGMRSYLVVLLFSVLVEPPARILWAAFGGSQSSVTQILAAYRKVYAVLIQSALRWVRRQVPVPFSR